MRGIHKHRPRGSTPELTQILEKFYGTPAGKKANASVHIAADVAKAKSVLEQLLKDRNVSQVSSTRIIPRSLDE